MKNCFAKNQRNCNVTTYKECPENCAFYKSVEQYYLDKRRAEVKIEKLPEKKKEEIRKKYSIRSQAS